MSGLRQRPEDQPLPIESTGPVIHDLVASDAAGILPPDAAELIAHELEARKALGISRYGRPLRAHNGRNALQDAWEEALDLAVYLRQMMTEATDDDDRNLIEESYQGHLLTTATLAWLRLDAQ